MQSTQPATSSRRALPTPPKSPRGPRPDYGRSDAPLGGLPDVYSYDNPYTAPYPYPPLVPPITSNFDDHPTTLRGGTLLHKGFYDLLSLIPSTPPASRFFWRAQDVEPVAGPRYEDIGPGTGPAGKNASPSSPPASAVPAKNLKTRRISKDMVSKPTGFVYVVPHPG